MSDGWADQIIQLRAERDALRAEVTGLREALRDIATASDRVGPSFGATAIMRFAHAALAGVRVSPTQDAEEKT